MKNRQYEEFAKEKFDKEKNYYSENQYLYG